MFVQVIQGHVTDRDAVHEAFDAWRRELAPGADGWLGTTVGVTPDGDMIALARFDSPEAAQRNSQRPEQDQWWRETSQLFADDPTFHDCQEVDTFLAGGSDQAGFVQVMQGRSVDPARLMAANREAEPTMNEYRPEIIGGTAAVHDSDGGRITEAVYFTSEDEAREGERRDPPPELADAFAAEPQLFTDVRYYDLPEPWFYSPRR